MNLKEVMYGFFLLLALTSNFTFFYSYQYTLFGSNIFLLGVAIFFNLIMVFRKLNDEHQLGAVFLSTSIVALLELILAGLIVVYSYYYSIESEAFASSVISLSGGALLANIISVGMYVIYTIKYKA